MYFRFVLIEKNKDGYGYPYGESALSDFIEDKDMIFIQDENFTWGNKRWNYETLSWEEYEPKIEEPQLNNFEVAQLDVLATIYEELLDIKENISSTV